MEVSEEETRKNARKTAKGASFDVDGAMAGKEEEARPISIADGVGGPRSGAGRWRQRHPELETDTGSSKANPTAEVRSPRRPNRAAFEVLEWGEEGGRKKG